MPSSTMDPCTTSQSSACWSLPLCPLPQTFCFGQLWTPSAFPSISPRYCLPQLSELIWIIRTSIAICISCVACNHLVLSLRGLYYTDHIYFDDSKVAPISGGGHDFDSSRTYTDHVGQLPADPFPKAFAQVPLSTIGSVTLDEGGSRSTIR